MFFRKKKLYDRDPKTLSVELLSILQASLVAKLITVNAELLTRWRNIAELSEGLRDIAETQKGVRDAARHLEQVNILLEHELARITKPARQISN